MTIKPWIEAMRLRTLPVSAAGVLMAWGFGVTFDTWHTLPALLCLLFALLAQIASNFANEYYDYRDGIDRVGRDGPRRGVTEGDITPRAMKLATYGVLAAACAVGLSLLLWGGLWLLPVGVFIALGALAYSAGPWPLSRHGLGEVAVMLFFGIVPVNLTYYVMSGAFDTNVMLASIAIGLMGANVLIVNNYRDITDDAAVGKRTLAVMIGRRATWWLYLLSGFAASVALFFALPRERWIVAGYLIMHTLLSARLSRSEGRAINPLLGMTAMAMFVVSLLWVVASLIHTL